MMGSPGYSREEEEVLVLERVYEASAQRIFAAWTDPQQVALWWGPPGSAVQVVELDCRRGGRYRFGITYPDRPRFFISGSYEAVEPPHRLVFSWRWESPEMDIGLSRVTIELAAEGARTRLRLSHALLPSVEARRNHREGWLGILENLAGFLAGGEGP